MPSGTIRHSHLLSDGGVFLEEEIHVDVKVASGDAPRHTPNNLQKSLLVTAG